MKRPSQPLSKFFALAPGGVVSNAGVEMRLYRKVLISEATGTASLRRTRCGIWSALVIPGQPLFPSGPFFPGRESPFLWYQAKNTQEAVIMSNPNIDLLGQVNLLRALQKAGIITETELRKVAARLAVKNGADIVFW